MNSRPLHHSLRVARESDDAEGVDTVRFSRIIAFLGAGTVKRMMGMRVLVCGLDGLGAEIAKNLTLSGVGFVTLHDTQPVTWMDLSSHFYLSEADLGKNRAESSFKKLDELNPYSKITVHTSRLTTSLLDNFDVVVMVNWPSQSDLLAFGDYCHNHQPKPIAFIKADARGLFSCVFADFGPCHVVLDTNGEEPKQAIVVNIDNSDPALITTHDEAPHGFSVGDYVCFEEVQGMDELNTEYQDGVPSIVFKVTSVKGLYTFEIDLDSTELKPYGLNGVVKEVKVQKDLHSRSYRAALDHPGEFIISDFAKFGRAEQYHVGFQALLEYQARHGDLPEPWNKEHAAEVVAIAKEINERAKERDAPIKGRNDGVLKAYEESKKVLEAMMTDEGDPKPELPPPKLEDPIFHVPEIDEALITKLAFCARGSLSPFAAFVGGVVGQEVLKKTGKYHPIHQWFYFDSIEALPEHVTDAELTGTRYDGQIAVFGKNFQQRLFDLNVFLVGAGALGCEFLKNFAMMGIACGKRPSQEKEEEEEGNKQPGVLFLTDMDNIETSNLSRQFLFRDSDLYAMKSVTAAKAARVINPELRITSSVVPVGESTEDTFDETFWKSQDIIVNALDNVEARRYVDSQCVRFGKPLLESGTLGTKANSQVILPHLTESYSSSSDPPDQGIPLCTLKNFPNQIEHTIEWARDKFQGYFTNSFEDANNLLAGDEFLVHIEQLTSSTVQRERLAAVDDILGLYKDKTVTFEDCVVRARHMFQDAFHNVIAQLLFNFPEDAKTTTGVPFWSGPKRPPVAADFDVNDETHLDFIVATANLLAFSMGLPQQKDRKVIANLVRGIEVPPFVPKKGVRIKGGADDDTVEGSDEDEILVKQLLHKFRNLDRTKFARMEDGRVFVPSVFEKDVDENFHVAFMTSASNIRAANYRIKPADFEKTKKIAGRIIPAIATTTAMITGLVSVEMYKVVLSNLPLERFRNTYVNLALPSFIQSEPMPCKVNKSNPSQAIRFYPDGWTLWDSFIIDEGNITFQELVDHLREKHNLNAGIMSCSGVMAYNPFNPVYKSRLNLKISEWAQTAVPSLKLKPTDKFIPLIVMCDDDDGNDVQLPDNFKVKFAK